MLGLLWLSVAAAAQQFSCDGSLILTLYDFSDTPTDIFEINYDGAEVTFGDIARAAIAFNSTGFNPADNFLYGTQTGTINIVRVMADGSYEVIGMEPELTSWNGGAGDCNKDGLYVAHNRENFKLYLYEVTAGFSRVASREMTWDPSTGNTGPVRIILDDLVFDPEDPGILYTYQRNYNNPPGEPTATKGALLRIDADPASPDFGTVRVVGFVPADVIIHIGSLFFNPKGELYGYGSIDAEPLRQNWLVRINKNTAEAELIGIGPAARNSDGCSCPFSLALEKRVDVLETGCDSIRVEYTFEIINGADVVIPNGAFEDRFTAEWIITGVDPPLPIGGSLADGSGPGSNTLIYENATIPADTVIRFTVRASTPAFIGAYSNQAFLETSDPLLGGHIPSDDPDTDAQEDETSFTIDQLPLAYWIHYPLLSVRATATS